MKATLINKLKIHTVTAKNYLFRKCFYFFAFIFRRRLIIEFISTPDPVVFSGNYFTLYVQVKGCYKIVIDNTIVLPGNTTRIHFDSVYTKRFLSIKFYGYKEVVEKHIPVNIVNAELKKQLDVYFEPGHFHVQLSRVQLRSFSINKLKYSNAFVPVIPVLLTNALPTLITKARIPGMSFFKDPVIQLEQFKPELLNTKN